MKIRAISALLAVLILIGTFFYFREQGVLVLSSFIVLLGILEYSRLIFRRLEEPLHIRASFVFLASLVYVASLAGEAYAFPIIAICAVVFLLMALLTIRKSDELSEVLHVQSMGTLGFLYCGLFPALAVRTLNFDGGAIWLFGLMAIVFSGDTFAYLTGRLIGRQKLLEPVSPKKTIEGSIGGLVGSALAGAVLGIFFLSAQPLWIIVLTSLVTGAFAQVGDLFESLLKRVAEVKDSGAIMPGHGGILDRMDGLLFAAPVYYILAKFLV